MRSQNDAVGHCGSQFFLLHLYTKPFYLSGRKPFSKLVWKSILTIFFEANAPRGTYQWEWSGTREGPKILKTRRSRRRNRPPKSVNRAIRNSGQTYLSTPSLKREDGPPSGSSIFFSPWSKRTKLASQTPCMTHIHRGVDHLWTFQTSHLGPTPPSWPTAQTSPWGGGVIILWRQFAVPT